MKIPLITISRIAVVLAMAVLFSTVVSDYAEAKRIPTNVPIAQRVQAQKDYCQIDGGTFTQTKTPFGATITNCTGGGGGLGKCVNMEKFTDCSKPLTRPPDGPYGPAPSTGTNAGGVTTGSGSPVIVGDVGWLGLVASPDSNDGEQDQADQSPGKTKEKAKKKKGGKRKK